MSFIFVIAYLQKCAETCNGMPLGMNRTKRSFLSSGAGEELADRAVGGRPVPSPPPEQRGLRHLLRPGREGWLRCCRDPHSCCCRVSPSSVQLASEQIITMKEMKE